MTPDKCFYCERVFEKITFPLTSPLQYTKDHILPQSKGGNNEPANITPSCSQCNNIKGNKTLDEFEKYLKHFSNESYLIGQGYDKKTIEKIIKNVQRLKIAVLKKRIEVYNPLGIFWGEDPESKKQRRALYEQFMADIASLVLYGKRLLVKYEMQKLDPWDLINETFVEMRIGKEKYNPDSFRVCMYRCLQEEKEHARHYLGIEAAHFIKKSAESCVCRKCNEILNINAFKRKEEGVYEMVCIDCYNIENRKNNKVYYKEKKNDSHFKQIRAKASRNYISNPEIREKHREKMREYGEFHKENLTDIYLKKLLRGRGLRNAQITEEIVSNERERQMKLRQQSKAA